MHFPFSKNVRKAFNNRFEPEQFEADGPPDVSPVGLSPPSEDLESIKNNKSLILDGHTRNIIKFLQKSTKDVEVCNAAEERLGIEMEKQRQKKIIDRNEF